MQHQYLKRLATVFAFAICLVFMTGLNASAMDDFELRLSAYYPPNYPVFHSGIKPWEEMVTKESDGKFTFKNYLNGVLHSAKHGFRAVMADVTDLTHAYPSYQPASFSLCHVNDMPFAFPSSHVGVLVMESLYPKYFKSEYERMGCYLGFWCNTSEYNLISKKPVRCAADLKGMKIRSFGGLCSKMLEMIGAVPVMVQSSESYTAFQNGLVDGVLYTDSSTAAYRLYEIGKFSTKLGIAHMGIPYALNKKYFDGLKADQKSFLYAKLRQLSQMASNAYQIQDQEARKAMDENGVESIVLPAEEMAKLHKAVAPMWEEFVAKYEADGLPARAMADELKALTAKYAAMTPEEAFALVTEKPIQGIINF